MSGNLRQLDMEKDLQGNFFAEVKMLKEQLRIAEEKLQAQCNSVNSMGLKISAARRNINERRRECCKLSKMCSALGKRFIGIDYKYASIKLLIRYVYIYVEIKKAILYFQSTNSWK